MDYILGIKYIAWKQPMEAMTDSSMQNQEEDEDLLSDESFELRDDDEV